MKANLSCQPGLFIFTRAFFSISTVTWAGRAVDTVWPYIRERERLSASASTDEWLPTKTQQLTSSFESPGVNESARSRSSRSDLFLDFWPGQRGTVSFANSSLNFVVVFFFTFPLVDVVGDVHLVLYSFLVSHNMLVGGDKMANYDRCLFQQQQQLQLRLIFAVNTSLIHIWHLEASTGKPHTSHFWTNWDQLCWKNKTK